MRQFKFDFTPSIWALPLLIRWDSNRDLSYIGIHILCFAVSYERWKA